MSFNILISDPLSEDGIFPLRQAEGMNIVVDTTCTPAELAEKIRDYDALLVRSQTQVTRDIIENAPNLKIIGRAGVGVDNIDLAGWQYKLCCGTYDSDAHSFGKKNSAGFQFIEKRRMGSQIIHRG